MKKALVTLAIGLPETERRALAIFRAYAARQGLDFVVIDTPQFRIYPNRLIKRRVWVHVEKFQLHRILGDYDRVLFLDADMIPHPDCPDLIGQVASGSLGCVYDDEGEDAWKRRIELQRMAARLGPLPAGEWRYFNSGLMVLDSSHQCLFRMRRNDFIAGRWPEQTLLNYRVLREGLPVQALDPSCNFMPTGRNGWDSPQTRSEAMLVHYAGRPAKRALAADLERRLRDWGLD